MDELMMGIIMDDAFYLHEFKFLTFKELQY
jgi:hypothetical protein